MNKNFAIFSSIALGLGIGVAVAVATGGKNKAEKILEPCEIFADAFSNENIIKPEALGRLTIIIDRLILSGQQWTFDSLLEAAVAEYSPGCSLFKIRVLVAQDVTDPEILDDFAFVMQQLYGLADARLASAGA